LNEAITIEEKRANLIVKYRGLEIVEREEKNGLIVLRVRIDDEKIVMHVILGKETIGIAYIRELKEQVVEEGAERGIIVGDGKYTYSARSNASEMGIELIPPNIPTFDIFEHMLVPQHEIITKEEREELIKKYHSRAYQFPWIKSTDPISVILGAKPGDVLKVYQQSETAGRYDTYRYVV
jgi:DNA-directed RNA polymerase subunit H (RpoH/RPB5)